MSQKGNLRRSMRVAHHQQPLRGGQMRSSVRSKGSSSTSTSDPRDKVKDCFRKLVAFMFTQVGVGALVVSYALVGAVGFIAIEGKEQSPMTIEVEKLRNASIRDLWNITEKDFHEKEKWGERVNQTLWDFQQGLVAQIKKGYDGRDVKDRWSFPSALMFCLSIFTMIGYGNLVPITSWGRALTIVYAIIGIPLYVLYFMNMGKVLAETFKWLYREASCFRSKKRSPPLDLEEKAISLEALEEAAAGEDEEELIIVPATACLWVMVGYIFTGTIMFAEWEKWNYLDSAYFCATSLCKIGIGDFVPGTNIQESREGNQSKLVINFIYLLLGMGLIAMCYNLMKEEVLLKLRLLREELRALMRQIRCPCLRCLRVHDYL